MNMVILMDYIKNLVAYKNQSMFLCTYMDFRYMQLRNFPLGFPKFDTDKRFSL